jgi:transcriptional regulator with XRE-family HTH domain
MVKDRPKTRAELAREAAGMTRKQLAKKARVSEAYLRIVERHGGASFCLADRLAAFCKCRLDIYIYRE